jgi:ribA/ribD-fused uncharacterized protein
MGAKFCSLKKPGFFTVDYLTAEHWMMAEKARLFNDWNIAEEIIRTEKAPVVKDLGRQIKNFDEETWTKSRYEIVVKGNFYKFSQNEELKKFLLSTGDKIIVEASPVDFIWGIGLPADNQKVMNPTRWNGLNLLGFALMDVREKIRKAETSFQFNNKQNTIILYRPVGSKELALIKQSGWKAFPPRLPEQPIFYPVLNEEYASKIAKEWNVPSSGSGFVTKFEVEKDYVFNYEIQHVGSDDHNELWIPSEKLEEFNNHIIGKIRVIREFK